MIATSTTSPLRVDFVPGLPGPGRLGMTLAPGKKDARWDRDLDVDLARLRHRFGVDVLVSLLEDHELLGLGIPSLVAAANASGIAVVRFPIGDGSVPASMPSFVDLVRQARDAHAAGRTLVAHCRGGLGRTGLFAACCVVAQGGVAAPAAMAAVRQARARTIETREQEAWVERFAAAWSGA